MLPIIVLAIILIVFIISSVEIVKENMVYVVEFFGSFNRVMSAGLNFRVPLCERVAAKVTLRQQNFAVTGRYPSKDKVIMDISANLIYSVIPTTEGVGKYVYALVDREASVHAAVENALRTYIATETHEGILEKKNALIQHIRTNLETQFKDWGINIVDFQITEVRLSANGG